MIITCPACATRYTVAPEVFPASGRSVKCARCERVWHATPEAEDPPVENAQLPATTEDVARQARNETDRAAVKPVEDAEAAGDANAGQDIAWQQKAAKATAEPAAAAIIDDGTGDDAHTDGPDRGFAAVSIETVARARNAARRFTRAGPQTGPARRIQAMSVGAMIALLIAGFVYREDVVAAVPSLGSLYRQVGLEVNLRGLAFENVHPVRSLEQGIPILRVQGIIRNVSDVAMAVPPIRLSLRSPEGIEIYRWTVQPETEALEPGATAPFRSLLSAPPANAAGLAVRFIDAEPTRVGQLR